MYVAMPHLFSIRSQHGGKLTKSPGRVYEGGKVNFVDVIDIDMFSVHDISDMMDELGCFASDHIYYYFQNPEKDLDNGIEDLTSDQYILNLSRHVEFHKVINVYTMHGLDIIKDFIASPMKPQKGITIEEIDEPGPFAIVPSKLTVTRRLNPVVDKLSDIGQEGMVRQASDSLVNEQEGVNVQDYVNVQDVQDVVQDVVLVQDLNVQDQENVQNVQDRVNEQNVQDGVNVQEMEHVDMFLYDNAPVDIEGNVLNEEAADNQTSTEQVGRPKKARKRSAVETEDESSSKKKGKLSKKNTKGDCGKCGNTGHNQRTCKGQGETTKA